MAFPRIFVSERQDPFANLAIENHLLETIQKPTMLLYQNASAVVMGRAQNPWAETDVAFLEKNYIPLLRRQSGGGTVVHDSGNLNFSFISPKSDFDKMAQTKLIAQSLKDLDLPVVIADHYDLFLQDKKISGSAFRETKHNCFHHGTLLINSNLDFLRRCLAVPPLKIVSKAIPSRRSSVTNLNSLQPHLTVGAVTQALIQAFMSQHQLTEQQLFRFEAPPVDWPIHTTIQKYQSVEWIYHHTLPFTVQLEVNNHQLTLHIENGHIVSTTPAADEHKYLLHQAFSSELIQALSSCAITRVHND